MKAIFSKILFTCIVISLEAKAPELSSIFEKSVVVENVSFIKIGTYRGFANDGSEYQKSYFYPRYSLKTPWLESRAACKSFDFELTSFDTKAEMEAVLNLTESNSYLRGLSTTSMFIDAMALTLKSPTDWYWAKSGQKISFPLRWRPGEPNNYQNANEVCLSLGKITGSLKFDFNDSPCTSINYTFLCQKIEFSVPFKELEAERN